MKKKPKKYTIFKNVLMFPGTVERLVSKGHEYVESYQYDLANQCFEEALQFTDGDELLLSVYAFSLYEAKSYEKAKEVCEKLLSIGPTMYLEVMELYLTICMQLKQFKQVESIIQSLIEEGAIPTEQLEKFKRLKELNANIAENAEVQEDIDQLEQQLEQDIFAFENFMSLTPIEQLNQIHLLTNMNIRPIVQHLKRLVENKTTHPFIQSMILILFVEQQIDEQIEIGKFEKIMIVNPSKLLLPTKMPQFLEISKIINEKLEQEPSVLEMVQHLIAKHAIVTYPFEWLEFDSEDVALSYIDFVQTMFGKIQEMDYEIIEFLQKLETLTELQEV